MMWVSVRGCKERQTETKPLGHLFVSQPFPPVTSAGGGGSSFLLPLLSYFYKVKMDGDDLWLPPLTPMSSERTVSFFCFAATNSEEVTILPATREHDSLIRCAASRSVFFSSPSSFCPFPLPLSSPYTCSKPPFLIPQLRLFSPTDPGRLSG